MKQIKQKLEENGLQLGKDGTQEEECVESEEPMEKEDIEHDEVPKTKNREEMTIEELEQENKSIQRQIEAAKELLEQKKKEELINSIRNGQQELKELKETLARLGLSLDN